MGSALQTTRALALVGGMLLLLTAPKGAAAGASADDTARLLAGMPPAATSPLQTFMHSGSWKAHAKNFDSAWAQLDKRQLANIRGWSAKNITQRQPTVFYMFSGPDFLYANAFYPDASTYVLSALEPVGAIPDVEGLSEAALDREVGRLQRSMNSVLSYSFFITKKMKTELNNGRLNGTLPVLYVFLARSGKSIQDVSLVSIDAEGVIHPATDTAAGDAATRHGVHQIAPFLRIPAISSAEYPTDASTSSVLDPISGVAVRIALEKPVMLIAEATTSASPITGECIGVAMPRCFTCGSANPWSIE